MSHSEHVPPPQALSTPLEHAHEAITAADLAALDRAIADGILTVSQRGRSVTFQNTTQLLAARTHVARLLARNQPGRAPTSGFARGISFGVADFR